MTSIVKGLSRAVEVAFPLELALVKLTSRDLRLQMVTPQFENLLTKAGSGVIMNCPLRCLLLSLHHLRLDPASSTCPGT